MRPVLNLSLVLLALILALNHARELFPGAARGALGARVLELVVGAKGPLLAAARLGGGHEAIGEEIRANDRSWIADGRPGLRAVFLDPRGQPSKVRTYDVARGQAGALLADVRSAPEGEVLVLASSGRLQPEDAGEPAPVFERALERLGARAPVGRSTPESWALIAKRGERGWIPLAEGYSRECGVALAFVLGREHETLPGTRADLVLARAPAKRIVSLARELAHASKRTDGVTLARARTVLGRRMDGLCLAPGSAGEPARLEWRDVELHEGSTLVAWIGLADDTSSGSAGAACEVRIDGQVVTRQLVRPGAPWKRMLVDLRPYAGTSVTLELLIDPDASAQGAAVLLGWPALLHGYDGSPLELWARER